VSAHCSPWEDSIFRMMGVFRAGNAALLAFTRRCLSTTIVEEWLERNRINRVTSTGDHHRENALYSRLTIRDVFRPGMPSSRPSSASPLHRLPAPTSSCFYARPLMCSSARDFFGLRYFTGSQWQVMPNGVVFIFFCSPFTTVPGGELSPVTQMWIP
jgi:hypothetical protein